MNADCEWKFIYDPSYTIPADTDDTVFSLIALCRYSVKDVNYNAASSNLLRYRDENGRSQTAPDGPEDNEIDLVVNANIYRWFLTRNYYLTSK